MTRMSLYGHLVETGSPYRPCAFFAYAKRLPRGFYALTSVNAVLSPNRSLAQIRIAVEHLYHSMGKRDEKRKEGEEKITDGFGTIFTIYNNFKKANHLLSKAEI
ncbi:MAG: hypothetical protein UX57_C0004G0111 [Candidatus Uhrbacteria bacterium GW2011_GWE2_46_68]|uniref:Uncharacterized protein n=2 Tax=Candidatus Uhriibacteriota TaxID=1752732 RepID=A0A0G1Q9A6_9BACT|nr:MAG: hypothetical protein UX45_C0001G0029 [Candidatus Uhrbacteria bacterium GW2011_GWF2_46_218]KKU41407.1 MAG: hypothetical protein UX57_C0004G0111 [Candidatus Uhrbacteria bacterium GW2011_GWE2_46_68]